MSETPQKQWQEMAARVARTEDRTMSAEAEAEALRDKLSSTTEDYIKERNAATAAEAERDALRAELDRPKHETLRQLADAVERNAALKAERDALRAEVEEAKLMASIEHSGCEKALAQMDDAVSVMQAQKARAERAEAALTQIAAWSWDSGSTPAPEVVSRIYCEARAALRDTAPVEPEATDGHWPDVNVGNPAPAKEPAERWCPVGCGAHEDPGPWHQRGCARWRDTAPAEEKRSYAPTVAEGTVDGVKTGNPWRKP